MLKTTEQDANGIHTVILYFMNSLFLRHCKRKGKRKEGRNFVIVKLSSL